MSKRVLYFKHFDGGSEFYRLKPLDYIDTHELTIMCSTEHNITWQLIDSFDIIVICRPSSEAGVNLIRLAHRLHKKVIGDYDDAIISVDQYNPLFSHFDNDKPNILTCLALLDEIWVATSAIKQSFRLYNKNIHVIPNSWDNIMFPIHKKKQFNFNKIASYRGGESHYGDIYDIGVPEQLIDIITNNRDWTFNFFGQRFHYLEKRTPDNYVSYPGGWPMKEFQSMMQDTNSAIFFYPLATTPFNRGKSNCSFLEATYAGSAFFGNKNLPEFNFDFVKSFSEIADWMENEQELRTMNEQAWDYIRENLLVSRVNKLRIERLII